jgi:hypothetical protein
MENLSETRAVSYYGFESDLAIRTADTVTLLSTYCVIPYLETLSLYHTFSSSCKSLNISPLNL